jgi:Na+/proline symporter
MQGMNATVVVTVVQGKVWVSISPPFTWEAIMEPGKVDKLLHVLELARDEAKEMVARNERAPRGDKPVVRAITRGPEA